MKIIKQYWDDIIKKRKFLEFRKLDFLENKEDMTSDSFFIGNGRIKLTVLDSATNITLGHIIFKGYKIIKKKQFWEDHAQQLYMSYMYGMEDWITKNKEFLEDYYKFEDEIMILFIEKAVSYER